MEIRGDVVTKRALSIATKIAPLFHYDISIWHQIILDQ